MIVGIDNLNDYYDIQLKYARLQELGVERSNFEYNTVVKSARYPNFQFIKIDIADKISLNGIFTQNNFELVCNLAAQAGIMYSTINPNAFIHSNITGFLSVLECCKKYNTKLIYASSSSVYGDSKKMPFSEKDPIATPKNLYAKTKIANEYLAKIYSEHFNIQTIGLRLFSVYGSFGRPDMAYMIFTKAMLNNLPLNIYGDGTLKRDYTFIDDVITAIEKIIIYSCKKQIINEIYNIGSSNPISQLELVERIENELNVKAIKKFRPIRTEEIETTFADISKLQNSFNYVPNTSIDFGIKQVIEWYKQFPTFLK